VNLNRLVGLALMPNPIGSLAELAHARDGHARVHDHGAGRPAA
jgi:hypothetical protein